jgi:phosphoribosylpyrophosphate synthetase
MEECVEFIIQNKDLNLEMLPIIDENLSENLISEGNLAIIGSRSFHNYTYAKKEILKIIQDNKIPITKIISGGASGADKIAEIFASKFNIPIEVLSADWSKGKQSGVIRNTDIINKSDYVIAFWDGTSKGTLDSINKAKKLNKKLFIVKISPETINEGVRLNDDNTYFFDFKEDKKDDILTLTYNKNYITSKKTNGIISYFSYKINKNIDKTIRFNLLTHIKNDLNKSNNYDYFLNKAVLGLFNNPNFEVNDIDLILIPESSSNLNLDLANKIKDKLPNTLFFKDIILKNEPENVLIDYNLLKEKKYKKETIFEIENMVKKATIDGVFKIKKIAPKFRKYILNFLKIDITNRRLLNKLVNGKVIVVDDIISEGTTFKEINRLVENYAPKEIILFSLIG